MLDNDNDNDNDNETDNDIVPRTDSESKGGTDDQ
jgi:hypothetical protein